MTEFAFVLPIFCLLLFGIIQFGILFNNYVTLTDAVRAGARKGAVSRNAGQCSDAINKLRAAAQDLDQSKLVPSCSVSPSWQHGAEVTVSATYPYQIDLIGIVVASGNLTSTTKERVE